MMGLVATITAAEITFYKQKHQKTNKTNELQQCGLVGR